MGIFLMKLLFLLVSSIITLVSCLQLEPTFRSTPKRIVFCSLLPGSSHVNWVLPWLDELALRGHDVTFITMDMNVKFAVPFPRIETIPVSHAKIDVKSIFRDLGSHPDPLKMISKIFTIHKSGWRTGFDSVSNYIESNQVDVVICDHMSDPCIDAVLAHDLPLVVTSTLAFFPDAKTGYINNDPLTMTEFTTQHQSISRRFYNKYILPLILLAKIKPQLNQLDQLKRQAGFIPPPHDQRTSNALKIVSSLYGLEPARPMGPLVELVGPVLSPNYADLDLTFKSYLDTHHKVAYVAFGQHAAPDRQDIALILTSLLAQVEKGHLDGIIWSSRSASVDTFPPSIVSSYSRKTWDLTGVFHQEQKGPLFITSWSPQLAVLLHPSVSVFLSHGGSNSLVESLYAGKRLLFYPFFGDQWGTARQMTLCGLGEYFGPTTPQAQVDERVEAVVVDQQGRYQANVGRYQAMVQIHSQTAPRRAADLVEEVAFASTQSTLPHRHDVGRSMSMIKRNNWDIHTAAVLIVVTLIGLVYRGVSSRRIKQKIL
uniref:Glycosyltransferase n=1 Tax=Absidia caerulea TaxID=90261 RepID=A0A1P8C3D3_9FUNG|nr:glycosyltransferase [Absidia caerulea]